MTYQAGAAAPRVRWRPNAGGEERGLADAIDLAARYGVAARDPLLRFSIDARLPTGLEATYGPRIDSARRSAVLWREYLTVDGRVVVRLAARLFGSDEALVAVIAHKTHEILALEGVFRDGGGRVTVAALLRLIDPILGTLHSEAWDVADALVLRLRADRGEPA